MWEKEISLLMRMSNFFFPSSEFPLCLLSFYYIVFLEKIKFHIDLHPCFLGKEAWAGAIFILSYFSRFISTMIVEIKKKKKKKKKSVR